MVSDIGAVEFNALLYLCPQSSIFLAYLDPLSLSKLGQFVILIVLYNPLS